MRFAAAFALTIPAIVLAAGTPNCNVGTVECCNAVKSANNPSVDILAGDLGIALAGISGNVGLDCSPISVGVGIGSNSCNAQTVCCDNNHFNGIISVGCSPISINL